jgi:hypothetical protein
MFFFQIGSDTRQTQRWHDIGYPRNILSSAFHLVTKGMNEKNSIGCQHGFSFGIGQRAWGIRQKTMAFDFLPPYTLYDSLAKADKSVPYKTVEAIPVHDAGHLQTLRRRKYSVPAALELIGNELVHLRRINGR